MRLSDVPKASFWPYDVFGYMLPGATFLTGVALGQSWLSTRIVSLWNTKDWPELILLLLGAYLTGHAISAISSLLIEAYLMSATWLLPSARLMPETKTPTSRWRRRWFWKTLRWFGDRLAPNYRKPYPEDFQNAVKNSFRDAFGEDFQHPHTRFWMCWTFISLHHPAAYRRGSHFVELYVFSRNTTMSFVLISLLPAFGCLQRAWTPPVTAWLWTSSSFVIALFFFSNYLKLMKRMDDEMFHAFVAARWAPLTEPSEKH